MFNKTMVATGVAIAVAAMPVVAEEGSFMDELEISGELKNESAIFTNGGQTIGQATSMTDTTTKHDSGDLYKSESSAKIFINGDVGEDGSSFHAELNLRYDTEAVDGYKGAKSYSQHDLLRELYVDTEVGNEDSPVSLRIGKQQVVWGTADGIKLLDIINPTDWREFAQNTMEEARIPIWMVNAEMDLDSGANLQFVLSQVEENKITGLNSSGDQGQPFVMKGVDSITGKVNGFLNVTPALSKVANTFSLSAQGGGFDTTGDNAGDAMAATGLVGFGNLTVDGFAGNKAITVNGDGSMTLAGGAVDGGPILWNIAQNGGAGIPDTNDNNSVTNLADQTWDPANPSSAFEYMANATFSTFNSFSGISGGASGVLTNYVRDYPSDSDVNTGLRFKNSTEGGFNYSVNYFHHYDANPSVTMDWYDSVTNQKLDVQIATQVADGAVGLVADQTTNVAASAVPLAATGTTADVVVLIKNPVSGAYYGMLNFDPNNTAGAAAAPTMSANQAELRFTEKLNRVHSLGTAFDYSMETDFAPVVLRGEFLYNKDELAPVVDKRLLAVGDLANSLTMQKQDSLKYVLGADVTVLTNLMLSGQFIQMRNLDYVDESRTCTTQTGTSFDCSKYTGDMATLHMSNGLNKAEENKEFYSFFMSKPFGAEQQHRWNNIFMFEENGGKWNRFDVEYSFNDELIGMAEMNKYWGDTNTQFGQMENSSNLQLGLKYIF